MQFLNNTSLEGITDKDVTVYLATGGPTIDAVENCRTFMQDGALWVDCIPQLHRKYVAPIPDDAIVSRNEEELTVGRYGVIVSPRSALGNLVAQLLAAKAQHRGK